uniref:Uncharacterized protein n=1 Tax=Timema monikensis TaxID=170555 RepID=A0A7R9EEN3_9NEOP|nr:unnamed protein product [Timema monikensis]
MKGKVSREANESIHASNYTLCVRGGSFESCNNNNKVTTDESSTVTANTRALITPAVTFEHTSRVEMGESRESKPGILAQLADTLPTEIREAKRLVNTGALNQFSGGCVPDEPLEVTAPGVEPRTTKESEERRGGGEMSDEEIPNFPQEGVYLEKKRGFINGGKGNRKYNGEEWSLESSDAIAGVGRRAELEFSDSVGKGMGRRSIPVYVQCDPLCTGWEEGLVQCDPLYTGWEEGLVRCDPLYTGWEEGLVQCDPLYTGREEGLVRCDPLYTGWEEGLVQCDPLYTGWEEGLVQCDPLYTGREEGLFRSSPGKLAHGITRENVPLVLKMATRH